MVGLTEKQAKAVPNTVVPITRTSSVEELAGIYSAADVFVNATYQDNFPTVNIEALACGTPIISYDTGGSPESYDPSCGLTVKKGDIHAMAEAVSRFAQYDRGNAVSRAKQFDRNIKYAEYLKIYSSVI